MDKVALRNFAVNAKEKMEDDIKRKLELMGITEKGTCTIVLNRNRINSPKSFRFTFQPMYYTESNPAGQYFGVLYYEYPYKVDLNTEKSIIINLPDVTDKLFNQYYLLGEYIQVTPNGIKWRGEYYKKQQ